MTWPMVLATADVRKKLQELPGALETAFAGMLEIPHLVARDVQVIPLELHPPKKGLSLREGQARLLHDLASIELQAMELALRTLAEYPEAPIGFREELVQLTSSEGEHLKLCLDGIEKLGHRWGDWPVHLSLWAAVDSTDSLIDRILIVHRYLEGSGLDAGETLLRRLNGVLESPLHGIVKRIVDEEVGHVEFGSRWYRSVCKDERLDPQEDFVKRLGGLKARIPKRMEKLSRRLRAEAGFTGEEMDFLDQIRLELISSK